MSAHLALLLAAGAAWGQSSRFVDLVNRAQKVQSPEQRVMMYTQAMAVFDHDVDAPQDKAIALVGRAYAYGDMRQFEKGLRDVAEAELVDPRDWTVHKAKAYILSDAGECVKSTTSYGAAIRLAPAKEKATLYREAGLVLRDCSKRLDLARMTLVHAVKLAGDLQDVEELKLGLRALATLVCRMKLHSEALQLFEQCLEMEDDTGVLYDLGVCQQAAGKPGDAKATLTEVIDRMEAQESAGKDYAEASRMEGEGTLTVTAVDTTVLPDSYYRRAQILRERGDEAAARADLARACELGLAKACPKKRRKR